MNAASDFLDKELQSLYQRVVPNDLHFDSMPVPQRTHTRVAQAVGSSYINVLMGWANPQGDDDSPPEHTKNALCE
eukprot:11272132-Ditylum_brightwellii.AAC.2